MERQQKSTGGRRLRHEPRGTNSVLLFLHQEPFRPLHLGSGNVTRRDPPSAASGGEDSVAIAESYASSSPLSASLSPRSLVLQLKTCSASMMSLAAYKNLLLMPHNKGNRYINSCLRLNEEMKSLESLAMQLYPFIKLNYKKDIKEERGLSGPGCKPSTPTSLSRHHLRAFEDDSPKDIVMEVHKKDIMNCGS
ncbi:hypothetical protein MUK42_03061 [Musa troglodytarum]|uniref:Uncharacterized protein n=1 Tax=Musa troglodytarum TaxID=320322 RepID=A0A9E7EK64_9LILI|nr:hypothetical protein MUK42_03061 [Musa troglodytarum]URD79015.1 hypothetical protein MUK42_03061 [Musa troglodytarum]